MDLERLEYVMVPGLVGIVNKELGLRLIYIDTENFEGKTESRIRELVDHFCHDINMSLLKHKLL